MANDLITAAELATWTQNDVDEVTVDPFAIEVMDKVSQMAKFFGGHTGATYEADGVTLAPEWTYVTAPFDVKMVVLQVAKRCYANPDQEVASGVGPISSRVLDAAALLLELTDSERATLTKYNAAGDPDGSREGGQIFVQPTTRSSTADLVEPILYVPDDSLSDWYIPMFNPGDPGDPNLYPTG